MKQTANMQQEERQSELINGDANVPSRYDLCFFLDRFVYSTLK